MWLNNSLTPEASTLSEVVGTSIPSQPGLQLTRPSLKCPVFDGKDKMNVFAFRNFKDEYWDKETIRKAIFEKVVGSSIKLPSECEQLKEHIFLIQYELLRTGQVFWV